MNPSGFRPSGFQAVIPAKAGIQVFISSFRRRFTNWIPAFAGMTTVVGMTAMILFLLSGCIPQVPQPSPGVVLGPSPSPSPGGPPAGPMENAAIFYRAQPEANTQQIIKILRSSPGLRLTLIFPAKYFEDPARRELIPQFRVLQSTGQIEMALTLENEPILPLLGNFLLAFHGTNHWNFNFSWPADIAYQIARGSGQYQKKWARLPAGFFPPYLSLSDQVVKVLPKFRLSYVLSKPQPEWGAKAFGSTTVLVPPEPPVSSHAEGSLEWADELSTWALNNPFCLIDGGAWTNPESETSFLNSLAKKLSQKPFPFQTHRGEELNTYLYENYLLPPKKDIFVNDFSPWIQSAQQKAAWQALGEARKVLESYRNSGRAVLSRLDAAQEEMDNAESGPFLLSLGQTQFPLPVNQRNFIATLANVYRLSGSPVPENLNRLFASSRKVQASSERTGNSEESFFEPGDKQVAWNDPAGDDFGSGTFRYPTGNYPAGSFDLKRFSIRWSENYVTFTITLAGALPSEKIQPLLPLIDIYIDVNKVSGAGSQDSLSQRGTVSIDRGAAWEYAVAMGLTKAVLYQSLPGKEPRRLGTFNPTPNPTSKSFSVTIPLDSLRGVPSEWRLSVALGGMEQIRQNEDPVPIPVLAPQGPKNFGGARGGRSAPRFIDLLDSTTEDQKDRIKVYESGRRVVLPFVEVP